MKPEHTNNNFFRQLIFIMALVVIGVVIWKQLSFFMSCFLGSITIYVILRRPLFYLVEKKHWKSWIASLLLVILTTLFLLGLGFLIFEMVASEVSAVDVSDVVGGITSLLDKVSNYIEHPLLPKDILMQSKGFLTGIFSGLLNTAYNFIFNLFMMVVVLYFMFANARKMEKTIIKYAPFKDDSFSLIKREIKNMIFSNAVGLPIIMFVQGLAATLGYWLLGVQDVVFWAFLTALFGLVPVVGTAGVWLSLAVYQIVTGNIWQGIILILYGILVISNADNACRLVLMKKMANTHPLIVVFGVILGIPLFGFWGIIFGPLLISGFLLLIKIYSIEYNSKETNEL